MTKQKTMTIAILILIVVIIAGWVLRNTYERATSTASEHTVADGSSVAHFAGGCFWCVESDFEKLTGVASAVSGYMGGVVENPSYSDHADHREAVEVQYNPEVVSYRDLVLYFFRHHDPTDEGGSFYDRGHSYTSAIYPGNPEEAAIAEAIIQELTQANVFADPIVTSVELGATFWRAEDYHQDYYIKNPIRYKAYRTASGRDAFVDSVWAGRDDFVVTTMIDESNPWSSYVKPSDEELKQTLDPLAYKVTQKDGTERAGTEGNHDKNYDPGIYVDILSGEPLFSSKDKFDSGTGWPSFTKPISDEYIVEQEDRKLVFVRTEVRSKYGDNHIGHVFPDGPEPTGMRYCMNGAALTFIPLAEMEEKGYGDYVQYVE